ncbi:uncharacterized protein LOC126995287, partial [Eriocheir sinensis]|uniref:uncharacterized protein LOC126995287 n=1 Tax=Eriocheir sinensis TaxID=95602 RepID=UPI0021C57FE6
NTISTAPSSSSSQLSSSRCMYGRANVSANYAMMFMVKLLASKWKQPLGYFFFAQSIKPDTL